MKMLKQIVLPFIAITVLLSSCSGDPQSPGVEYMPDMYRSPAIEEYVDYGEIRDRIVDSLAIRVSALVPPKGTIPFAKNHNDAKYNFPYAYPNTDLGYKLATDSLRNPMLLTREVFDEGKSLYGRFCLHCHGDKGNGDGSVTSSGAFPPPPAYSKMYNLTEGKMFHSITYGKGMMGSHSGQLNKKQIWTLVHYVSALKNDKNDYKSFMNMKKVVDETDNN